MEDRKMPRFTGQNKKRIDPRYFLEETIEEADGYRGSKYASADPVQSLVNSYRSLTAQLSKYPHREEGSPEHQALEKQYEEVVAKIEEAGLKIDNRGDIINPETGQKIGKTGGII